MKSAKNYSPYNAYSAKIVTIRPHDFEHCNRISSQSQKENPKTVLACLQWTQIECFKQTNKGQHSSDTVPVSSAQKQV